MLGAVEWSALELASAFVAGTVLGVVIVLRVVRAVAHMFGVRPARGRRSSEDDEPASS
jgi:F0F1-type ATP synthase assembly protein I